MYATPTGPENVYLELQPKTRMKVDEVYENVVEDESATDVGVQRVNIGNTNQDGSNRRQAPPKTLTPTGPEKVYLGLQPKTRIKVDEVYENVVENESATDVAVQRVNIGNTNQDGRNRRQAPAKKFNALRKDVRKIQRMQLLIFVAVVITFLTAVVSLVFVITIKWTRNTPAVSKQGAEEGTIQGRMGSESYT